MELPLASYSVGNFSYNIYPSLLTPINSAGFNYDAFNRPVTGEKIVCLVVVLITTPFPEIVA